MNTPRLSICCLLFLIASFCIAQTDVQTAQELPGSDGEEWQVPAPPQAGTEGGEPDFSTDEQALMSAFSDSEQAQAGVCPVVTGLLQDYCQGNPQDISCNIQSLE